MLFLDANAFDCHIGVRPHERPPRTQYEQNLIKIL